ncbi:unnamed protein product [Cylindrotheca closterium]|uniref:Uncharacterized protein n=1 Tax=Cylindrotheca closterium TaxID=2856 RepID=A0AAD2CBR8_9STRA|nr:unnamed protein product [Cylindrotheca closterium]
MSSEFLASMTFANGNNDLGCDCDECGVPLPAPIMAAVRKRKWEMIERRPMFSTQERSLISRQDGTSIWKTVVPVGSDPLVEFGQSHRILWVKQLDPKTCHIKSIGEGIIGSSSEEDSRKRLDWEEGDIYLVKSNGGKAIGWTHCLNKEENAGTLESSTAKGNSDDSTPSVEPAILITIKIPLSKKSEDTTPSEDELPDMDGITSDSWASYFLKLSQIVLNDCKEHSPGLIKLSEEYRKSVRHAMGKVQSKAQAIPNMTTGNGKAPIDSFALAPGTPMPRSTNQVDVATEQL